MFKEFLGSRNFLVYFVVILYKTHICSNSRFFDVYFAVQDAQLLIFYSIAERTHLKSSAPLMYIIEIIYHFPIVAKCDKKLFCIMNQLMIFTFMPGSCTVDCRRLRFNL